MSHGGRGGDLADVQNVSAEASSVIFVSEDIVAGCSVGEDAAEED